jgi:hypothetical protein
MKLIVIGVEEMHVNITLRLSPSHAITNTGVLLSEDPTPCHRCGLSWDSCGFSICSKALIGVVEAFSSVFLLKLMALI